MNATLVRVFFSLRAGELLKKVHVCTLQQNALTFQAAQARTQPKMNSADLTFKLYLIFN